MASSGDRVVLLVLVLTLTALECWVMVKMRRPK